MTVEPISTGIHTVDAERYHADPAERPSLTASIAHHLVNSTPLHAWAAHPRLNPSFERVEKRQFDRGTVAHALLLQNEDVIEVVHADSWQTNAAKAARDEARAAGRIPLLAGEAGRVREMVESIRDQIAAREDDPPLLADGKAEQTLVWEEHGVTCRARLDWLRDDYLAIDDLKTTARSANPLQWARNTLWSIGSDIQVAFYLRGVKRLTGVDAQFRYILAEMAPPYAVSVVSMGASALELGNAKVERALTRWRECLKTDLWPGYPPAIYYAETPAWEEMRWMEQDAEALAS